MRKVVSDPTRFLPHPKGGCGQDDRLLPQDMEKKRRRTKKSESVRPRRRV